MSDAEARAKAEEFLSQFDLPLVVKPVAIASLAALLRDAVAGTWSNAIPRGSYGDRVRYWWRDKDHTARIIEFIIGPDGVASHPTWAILPGSEFAGPIPEPR